MRRFLLVLSFVFLGVISYSQGVVEKMIVDEATNTPKYIKFNTAAKALPESKAADVLREELQLPKEADFKLYKEETDPVFGKLLRYQQYFEGVKVEFGRYYVHAQNGVIVSINGEYKPIEKFNINPSISEAQAFEAAKKFIGAQKYAWETNNVPGYTKGVPQGELVIVEDINPAHRDTYKTYRLAYKFDIYASEPVSRDYVYVDAQTGKVLFKNSIIKFEDWGKRAAAKSNGIKETTSVKASGNAETRYSGTQTITTYYYNGSYLLRDYDRGNGIFTYNMHQGTDYNSATDFSDNDNSWTATEYHNTAKDDAALDAHWACEKVYDYWKNVHGRNSYDNNNAAIKSYVHYSTAYDNAYWNGSVLTFGDGSDTYFDALTSIDVVAHEVGHAVCSNTADLTYQDESGALNEGLSDIWGACVEYYAAPNKETWIMGEDIDRRSDQAYPGLRNLANPKDKGLPDTYGGEYWYTGTSDNGGVHTNMGVLSYAFYLMSEGGSGTNDLGNSYSVTGIGIDKAAKIIYRVESVYATSSTDYADFRGYAIQAAEDLYGAGSQEVITTTNAFYAVGVGAAYGQVSYCASKGSNSNYEWIAKVVVGDFSNSSSAAGYTDFTSKTINLTAGQTYNISLTPGFASTTYDEYFKVWIDYNHDGDFDDSGELVYDPGSMTQSTISGSFTVPSTAAGVTTRMRVSMKYNGAPTSCETFSYGEVEDYTVAIAAGTADTEAPSAPSSLTASNVTTSSVDLSWTASTDNVGVSGYYIYKNGSYLASTTSTSYTVSGLTAGTTYSFYVKAYDAAGNVSAASNTVSVTTDDNTSTEPGPMPTGYCSSYGQNANYEWIDLVRLGDIDNSTGSDGGYKDYTNLSTTLTAGSENTIYISAGFASTSYTEYWAIYIDYNRDGDFEDSGEEIISGSSSSDATLYGTFTVPTSVSLGTTRMRVSMKYNAAQTPCEAFTYGEVEDYAVVLSTQSVASNNYFGTYGEELGNEASRSFSVYPNPVRTTFSVEMTTNNNVKYAIYTTTGKQVKAGSISASSNVINVSDLPAGIYSIKFNDGQKEIVKKLIKM